jgi:putative phage-type endonuclease
MGIGGSDVAAVCGLSKYKSAYELWYEKTGESAADESVSESAYWGNVLEPVIRAEFIKRTGYTVSTVPAVLQHPEHEFMLANIDGIVHTNEGDFIFEAKTANAFLIDEWSSCDYVPYPYQLQVQHYMSVTGLQGAYIAALVGGNQFCCRFIKRDDALIEMLIKLERQFWQYVLDDTAPPVDGSDAAAKFLAQHYPNSIPKSTIPLPEEALLLVEQVEYCSKKVSDFEFEKQEAENQLKQLLGENEIGTVGDRVITWKTVNQERVDTKRLSLELPDVHRNYLTKSSYRRFGVKQVVA